MTTRPRLRLPLLASLLGEDDARRAAEVLGAVVVHGLPCALTGGLALAAHLRASGRTVSQRQLHDIDLVVPALQSIPHSLASAFVLNHVHPYAMPGKTLLQLIDAGRAVRVDLFRT